MRAYSPRGTYRPCSISGLPSTSAKNAMWHTPVSTVSPKNDTPLPSRCSRMPLTSSVCSATALVLAANSRPARGRVPDAQRRAAEVELRERLVERVLGLGEAEHVGVERGGASASWVGIGTKSTRVIAGVLMPRTLRRSCGQVLSANRNGSGASADALTRATVAHTR